MRYLVLAAMIAMNALLPLRAQAQSAELVRTWCPKGYVADQDAERAYHLAESDFRDLFKEAAAEFYDCYTQQADPYGRDWTHLYYLTDLGFSARNDESGLDAIFMTINGLDELATDSQYPDVRSAAQKMVKAAEQVQAAIKRCISSGGC